MDTATKDKAVLKALAGLPARGTGLTEDEILRLTEHPAGVLVSLLTEARKRAVNHRTSNVEFDDNRMGHWLRKGVDGVEEALRRKGIDPGDIPWPEREKATPRILSQSENKEQGTRTTVFLAEVAWEQGSGDEGPVLHALVPTPDGGVLPARQRLVTSGYGMHRKTTAHTSVNGGPETTSVATGRAIFRVSITKSAEGAVYHVVA